MKTLWPFCPHFLGGSDGEVKEMGEGTPRDAYWSQRAPHWPQSCAYLNSETKFLKRRSRVALHPSFFKIIPEGLGTKTSLVLKIVFSMFDWLVVPVHCGEVYRSHILTQHDLKNLQAVTWCSICHPLVTNLLQVAFFIASDSKMCSCSFSTPKEIWTHYVLTYRSLTDANDIRVFLQGEEVEGFVDKYCIDGIAATEQPFTQFTIGPQEDEDQENFPEAAFDEIIVWHNNLSIEVITTFYNYYKGMAYNIYSGAYVRMRRLHCASWGLDSETDLQTVSVEPKSCKLPALP